MDDPKSFKHRWTLHYAYLTVFNFIIAYNLVKNKNVMTFNFG